MDGARVAVAAELVVEVTAQGWVRQWGAAVEGLGGKREAD